MEDVRLDTSGRQRCWSCGGFNFTQQRTARSKVGFGISSVLTKPKLRCVRCDEYNDVGGARPYVGPASRKYKAEWQKEQGMTATVTEPQPAPGLPTRAMELPSSKYSALSNALAQLNALRSLGDVNEQEYQTQRVGILAKLGMHEDDVTFLDRVAADPELTELAQAREELGTILQKAKEQAKSLSPMYLEQCTLGCQAFELEEVLFRRRVLCPAFVGTADYTRKQLEISELHVKETEISLRERVASGNAARIGSTQKLLETQRHGRDLLTARLANQEAKE